ncbi:MAG: SDR family oxidoreductase, partial [Pseudomonadota bacterium]
MTVNATYPDLKGASVFITGGGSGIGAALTEGFLAQGAKVAFVQRSDGAAFCDEMEKAYGNRPLFIKCDLTDVDALKAALAQSAEAHGPITVLVNNAANDKRHSTAEMSVEDWDWNQAINLRPYFFAAQGVTPGMKAAGGGSIINFSSISYMMGNAGYPSYVTANAGITGMTRGLAREFGPDKIRVNALAPGWVMTQKQRDMWVTPEGLEKHLERQCLKEEILPEDIVAGTLFLASSGSRMMTGQVMVID